MSELKISLSLPPDFSERILSSSCMVIRIRKEMSCQNKTLCFNKNVVKKVFRDVMKTENNSVIIEMRLKPALKRNTKYQFDIVLNQGWCSEGAKNGSLIKNGDLFNSVEEQFKNGTASVDVIESITLKTFYDDGQKTGKNLDFKRFFFFILKHMFLKQIQPGLYFQSLVITLYRFLLFVMSYCF